MILNAAVGIVLTLALWVACRRVVVRFAPPGAGRFEREMLAVLVGVSVISVLGVLLALAGGLRPLILGVALATLAAGLWFLGRGPAIAPTLRPARLQRIRWMLLGLVLAAGLGLYFRPDGNVLGAWDPGVYVTTGVAMARTGSWLLEDTASPLLSAEEKTAIYGHARGRFVKTPGFAVDARHAHTLQPEFFPLYPVWIALLTLLAGPHAGLLAGSLFALLSACLLLALASELQGGVGMGVALAAFVLSPVQIWFSGFHTAEIVMQTFVIGFVWAWVVWRRTRSPFPAACAGLFLGCALYTSVTALLFAALAAAAHAVVTWRRRDGLALYPPLALCAALSVVQNLLFTDIYFRFVSGFLPMIRRLLCLPVLVVAVLGLVAWGTAALLKHRGARLPAHVGRGAGLLLGGLVLPALAWQLYRNPDPGMAWTVPAALLSKTGLMVAWMGLVLLVVFRPGVALVVVAVPLIFSLLFARQSMMSTMFPWAFKRYLAVFLPMACLWMGYAFDRAAALAGRRAWWLALTVMAGVVITTRPLYRGHAFAFERDWPGLGEHLDAVAALTPPDAVLLARRDLGAPLEHLHARTVLPVYGKAHPFLLSPELVDVVAGCLAHGRDVYVVRDQREPWGHPFRVTPVATRDFTSRLLVQSRTPFEARIKYPEFHTVVEQLSPP